jgi:hypothetical protein
MSGVSRFTEAEVSEALARVRAACLALPETSERQSHDGPAFSGGHRGQS